MARKLGLNFLKALSAPFPDLQGPKRFRTDALGGPALPSHTSQPNLAQEENCLEPDPDPNLAVAWSNKKALHLPGVDGWSWWSQAQTQTLHPVGPSSSRLDGFQARLHPKRRDEASSQKQPKPCGLEASSQGSMSRKLEASSQTQAQTLQPSGLDAKLIPGLKASRQGSLSKSSQSLEPDTSPTLHPPRLDRCKKRIRRQERSEFERTLNR